MEAGLELRARASLLVWPFLAMAPILLASSLGRDEEELAEPDGVVDGQTSAEQNELVQLRRDVQGVRPAAVEHDALGALRVARTALPIAARICVKNKGELMWPASSRRLLSFQAGSVLWKMPGVSMSRIWASP